MPGEKRMRKRFALVLAMALIFVALCGCGKNEENESLDKGLNIVCTTYPAYDWVSEIAGEKAEEVSVTLLGNGAELHSFQPTARDIAKLHSADLIITVGGVTDAWIDDAGLPQGVKKLRLFDLLDEAELIANDKHLHDHNHAEHSDDEYDEHIWLSLRFSKKLVNGICDSMCELDKKNGVIYQKNALNYCYKLKDLDEEYKGVAENSKNKSVIFADRFPFAYTLKDYKIKYYAAFRGCTSDSDASFETVARLVEAVRNERKRTVLVLENSNQAIVKAINSSLEAPGVSTVIMNSCQTVNVTETKEFDYIEVMRKNLESLKIALEQ
jgi:zinc transport system substrate-binding protein